MKTFAPPCGILAILFLAVSCLFLTQMKAQTIEIDSIFTFDGEIFPFSPNDTIYGLSISGSVTLLSDTSLVRVILTDDTGNEWMVYEAYPMIVTDTAFDIEEACDETCYLNGIKAYSIMIQLSNARLSLFSINMIEEEIENIELLIIENAHYQHDIKLNAINQYIDQNKMLWRAGANNISALTHFEKRKLFGNKYKLYGFEFYIGGIYDATPFITPSRDESPLVKEIDWRKKHNAHIPNTFYHDLDPDYPHLCTQTFHETGNGWMTMIKDQDPLDLPDCQNTCDKCC